MWTFRNRGADAGTGIDSVAVDSDCVYYSMYSPKGEHFGVSARAKPAGDALHSGGQGEQH